MAVEAQVGFVAITNHLLDAAKSNRCALLLRAKPDHDELMDVSRGCLGTEDERRRLPNVKMPGGIMCAVDGQPGVPSVLGKLCERYQALMEEKPEVPKHLSFFTTFFGLRDFMHFIKLLGRLSRAGSSDPTINREKIREALERNMNGVEANSLKQLVDFFSQSLGDVAGSTARDVLRNPYELMQASLAEQGASDAPISRYKLVIDTTADELELACV